MKKALFFVLIVFFTPLLACAACRIYSPADRQSYAYDRAQAQIIFDARFSVVKRKGSLICKLILYPLVQTVKWVRDSNRSSTLCKTRRIDTDAARVCLRYLPQ